MPPRSRDLQIWSGFVAKLGTEVEILLFCHKNSNSLKQIPYFINEERTPFVVRAI